MNRILLLGSHGQVAWELARSLMLHGKLVIADRSRCDLTQPNKVRSFIEQQEPDIIINAAAYTAVDKAEEDLKTAEVVNSDAVEVIANVANSLSALLIHYSTDYVFDGKKREPYSESDRTNPINNYGLTKLKGETVIQEIDGKYLIFRTSWVYSSRRNNFFKTILRLAHEREELSIVSDQIGAPTWARNIADVTSLSLRSYLRQENNESFSSGIYHLASKGETSWYGFATSIVDLYKSLVPDNNMQVKKINPIPSSDYRLPAARPLNSRLSSVRLEKRFGICIPDWEDALKLCVSEFVDKNSRLA